MFELFPTEQFNLWIALISLPLYAERPDWNQAGNDIFIPSHFPYLLHFSEGPL